jgi:hypothetical protein
MSEQKSEDGQDVHVDNPLIEHAPSFEHRSSAGPATRRAILPGVVAAIGPQSQVRADDVFSATVLTSGRLVRLWKAPFNG